MTTQTFSWEIMISSIPKMTSHWQATLHSNSADGEATSSTVRYEEFHQQKYAIMVGLSCEIGPLNMVI
jgi:hypothetical protein